MSARLCVKCGYDLSGLPAVGTVVTCPECEHATDLSILGPVRVNEFAPFLWAMVPAGLCCVVGSFGAGSERVVMVFTVTGLTVGAITAGVVEYRLVRCEAGRDSTPYGKWKRLMLSVFVAAASVTINALVALLFYVGLSLIVG